MLTRKISFADAIPTQAARVFVGGVHATITLSEEPMSYIVKEMSKLIGKPLSNVIDNVPHHSEMTGKFLKITDAIATNTRINRIDQPAGFDLSYDLHCYYKITDNEA